MLVNALSSLNVQYIVRGSENDIYFDPDSILSA